MSRHILLPLVVPALLVATGCSGGDSSEASSADELDRARTDASAAINLKDYGLTAGIIGTGAAARKLYADMKASNGAKDVGEGVLLGGLTGEQLGFTDEDDKDESFGISCTPASADHTFHADTCSFSAIVKKTQKKDEGENAYTFTITGKLAKGIATALPRTSPAGLVGSMTTSSGKISCKTIPGPTGAECTVPVVGVFQLLDEAVSSSRDSDSPMTEADAKKLVKAFF